MENLLCRCCLERITADNTFTEEGWKEVSLSGFCEECFDKTFLAGEIEEKAISYIENSDVLSLLREFKGVFLGGGALRSFVDITDKIMDLDIFLKTSDDLENIKNKIKEIGYEIVFECPKGKLTTFKKGEIKVQIVAKRDYSDIYDLVESFDLSACRAAIELNTLDIYLDKTFVSSVLNKHCKIVEVEYPLATLKRVMKYRDKGYKFSSETLSEYLKIVSNMELNEENMALYID